MAEILKLIEDSEVFRLDLVSENRVLIITELCEKFHDVRLKKAQVKELIKEITSVYEQMID